MSFLFEEQLPHVDNIRRCVETPTLIQVAFNINFYALGFSLSPRCAKKPSVMLHRIDDVRVVGAEQALINSNSTFEQRPCLLEVALHVIAPR